MEPSEDGARSADPQARFISGMRDAMEEHATSRAARVVNAYRPRIVADVGETITGQVLDNPAFWGFIASANDSGMEPEEAAHLAAEYLRDHPAATAAEAFTVVGRRAAGE